MTTYRTNADRKVDLEWDRLTRQQIRRNSEVSRELFKAGFERLPILPKYEERPNLFRAIISRAYR